jgi:hypothetical protein
MPRLVALPRHLTVLFFARELQTAVADEELDDRVVYLEGPA